MSLTIKDVAREAGVSIATVSKVINGKPSISESTRCRVLEVIKRLNYHPMHKPAILPGSIRKILFF